MPGSVCSVGSVKANIGHAEAASGIVQLIKVLLQLKHRTLCPLPTIGELNPELNLNGEHLTLQEAAADWSDVAGQPRRALINSFAAGGSNACVVVEEYRVTTSQPSRRNVVDGPCIAVFSARNSVNLEQLVKNFIQFAEQTQVVNLVDIAYTLQTGREAMTCRLAVVADRVDDLIAVLREWLARGADADSLRGRWFAGDLTQRNELLDHILSGAANEVLLDHLLTNREYDKIALLWARGNEIPWRRLYQDARPDVVALPTYPFVPQFVPQVSQEQSIPLQDKTLPSVPREKSGTLEEQVIDFITGYLSSLLGVPRSTLGEFEPLQTYGVDSIISARLARAILEAWSVELTIRNMFENPTIRGLGELVGTKLGALPRSEPTQVEKPPVVDVAPRKADADIGVALLESFKNNELSLEEIHELLKDGVVS